MLQFTSNIRTVTRSDFDCGVVSGNRLAGLGILETGILRMRFIGIKVDVKWYKRLEKDR